MKSVLFPKLVKPCLVDLNIAEEDYIYEHSAMAFYQLFLKKNIFKKVCEEMLYTDKTYILRLRAQQGVYAQIKSDRLFYCPLCMQEHLGFESIKLFHQIRGVHVCPTHMCYLNSISILSQTKLLDIQKWDMSIRKCEYNSMLIGIAEDAEYIINNPPKLSIEDIRENLLDAAWMKGVISCGRWIEGNYIEWNTSYNSLPEEYVRFKGRSSFKAFAAAMPIQTLEPIEYLIFIRSLFGSFKNYFEDFVYVD